MELVRHKELNKILNMLKTKALESVLCPELIKNFQTKIIHLQRTLATGRTKHIQTLDYVYATMKTNIVELGRHIGVMR